MPRPLIVHLVNRSTLSLDFMDDGIPYVALPGYRLEEVRDEDGKIVLTEALDATGNIISEQPAVGKKKEPRMVPKLDAVPIDKHGSRAEKPYAMALPLWAAIRGVRTHPVMGTQDPYQPTRFLPYLSIIEYDMDTAFIPRQDDKPERLDRSMLPPDRQNITILAAFGGRKMKAGPTVSKQDKERDVPSELANLRGAFTIENLTCPSGFRMDYD